MPREFDFDRYLRDYQMLTPLQRHTVVRIVVRDAKAERAEAMRALFRAVASRSEKALARAFGTLRPVGAAIRDAAAAAWRRYDRRRRLRKTAAQLYGMDDRELKDIGLRRGDIDFVLSGIKDPTRRPRTVRATRDVLGSTDYSSPSLQPAQRGGAPLLLRKECA